MTIKTEQIPHYTIESGVCEECKVSKYGTMTFLEITIKHDQGSTQNYPAFNAPDIKTTEQYLCKSLDLLKIEDLKGKKIWSISGFSEIFSLVNPKNKKTFNLKSFYLSQNFKTSIEEHKKMDEYKNINLDDTEMINFISLNESIKKLNLNAPDLKNMHDDIKKYLLFVGLDSSLDKKESTKPKIKI